MYTVKLHTHTLQLRETCETSDVKKLTTSAQTAEYARTILSKQEPDQEHILLFGLTVKNKIKGFKIISSGGLSESTIDFKILFRHVFIMGYAAIIVCHNHPSGDVYPSLDDKRITDKLKQACNFLDIKLLDHVIVNCNDANSNYFSFGDEGLI